MFIVKNEVVNDINEQNSVASVSKSLVFTLIFSFNYEFS